MPFRRRLEPKHLCVHHRHGEAASIRHSNLSRKPGQCQGLASPWRSAVPNSVLPPATHLVLRCLCVEVLAKFHDFEASLAQRGAHRRAGLGLPRRDDQPYRGRHRLGLQQGSGSDIECLQGRASSSGGTVGSGRQRQWQQWQQGRQRHSAGAAAARQAAAAAAAAVPHHHSLSGAAHLASHPCAAVLLSAAPWPARLREQGGCGARSPNP